MIRIICFSVCLVSVVLAVLFGLVVIWSNITPDTAWRGFLSLILFFGGSLAIETVNEVFTRVKPQ